MAGLLYKDVVDATVNNEYLIKVTVRNAQDGSEESMLCSPDATAQDVKEVLSNRRRLGYTHHVEMRLTDAQEAPVFGSFPKNQPPLATRLNLRVVPLDPRLESLYQLVGMGVESERDRMMERMLVQRNPRDCPGGHSLPLEQPSHGRNNVMMCQKCVWHAFRGRGCQTCNYALCSGCLQDDHGLSVTDPYEAVVRIAVDIGRKIAGVLGNSGLGLVSTSIRWRSDLGEIRPSLFPEDPRWHGLRIDDSAQVLHNGVRLIVRLSERLREVVRADLAGEKDSKEDGMNTTKVLCPGEVDEVLENGATLLELKQYGKALVETESWTVVTRVLQDRASRTVGAFEDKPKAYVTTLKLVSFGFDQVIYEVCAKVDGHYLAAKNSFPGECGFSFGNRSRHIEDRLRASGATL